MRPVQMSNVTRDPRVDNLRWVMLAVMLVGVGLTLAGQPSAFWSDPATAIRGDGLSIRDPTNHSFEFCLGYGWRAYLACCLVYLAAAFLLVSTLPRWVAVVLLFTVTLGHVSTPAPTGSRSAGTSVCWPRPSTGLVLVFPWRVS